MGLYACGDYYGEASAGYAGSEVEVCPLLEAGVEDSAL